MNRDNEPKYFIAGFISLGLAVLIPPAVGFYSEWTARGISPTYSVASQIAEALAEPEYTPPSLFRPSRINCPDLPKIIGALDPFIQSPHTASSAQELKTSLSTSGHPSGRYCSERATPTEKVLARQLANFVRPT